LSKKYISMLLENKLKMMKTIKKPFILLVLLVVGCSDLPTSATVTETPVSLLSPEIATTLPEALLSNNCIDIEKQLYRFGDLSSILVIYRSESYGLLNLEDSSFIEVTKDLLLEPEVSPDGKKIAVYKFGVDISFFDSNGNALISFPWNENWSDADFYWLDENTFAIFILSSSSLDILNVNAGEIENIAFPYSGEVYAKGGVADFRKGFVRYSLTRESVIYAVSPYALVLRNSEFGTWSDNTVAWARNTGTNLSEPVWSPQGDLIALSQKENGGQSSTVENIFIVSTTGEDIKVTDLSSEYTDPYRLFISTIKWSPDGTKIAFVTNVIRSANEDPISDLLIFDWSSKELKKFCNLSPNNHSSSGFLFVWSPDGKYIATDTMIIDLESQTAFEFPDIKIVGWVSD
jgi:hypothetical protein